MTSTASRPGASYHAGLEPHEANYIAGTMDQWTNEELRWWTRLLEKRAEMRTNEEKRAKDLYDAKNYAKSLYARSAS